MIRLWSLTLLLVVSGASLWAQSERSPNPPADKTSVQDTPAGPASKAEAAPPTSAAPSSNPGDSTRLQAVEAPRPVYPPEAEARKIQGQVLARLLISATGGVENVEIISGDPALTKAAEEAFKRWKFKPYIKNGKAIEVSVKLPMDFALGNLIIAEPTNSTGSQEVKRVRVSQAVVKGMLISVVTPKYPDEARRGHIQGMVLLGAVIGKDGRVVELRAMSGPELLVPAAATAVQQWRFKPYILNNEPVEVETQITVDFTLGR